MDLPKKKRLKVLFIASWYPNKEHPVSGIFIKSMLWQSRNIVMLLSSISI